MQILGIVEEQHPNRTRLFMQWKKMDFPVMVDALNLLDVAVVPITILIDEFSVIRAIQPKRSEFIDFLDQAYEKPSVMPEVENHIPNMTKSEPAAGNGSPGALRYYADAAFLWGKISLIGNAIDAYKRAIAKKTGDASTHFRLGVAYRRRYDSNQRQDNDFQNAVKHWSTALELNPNQYIYRRRIQQYGARLDKPYSFYDWVKLARQEIRERWEEPIALLVEPGGAEFAEPAKEFETEDLKKTSPDSNRNHHSPASY